MKNLFILFAFILLSCSKQSEYPAKDALYNVQTLHLVNNSYLTKVEVDECEYLVFGSHSMIHNENCKNPIHHNTDPRSYQFQIINQDHAFLYDGNKLVGIFKFTNTELDSLIKKDNL